MSKKIKNYFQKAYGRKLSDKEIEEIRINLKGFLGLLIKFNQEDKQKNEKNNNQ
jgi:hypothetical protein